MKLTDHSKPKNWADWNFNNSYVQLPSAFFSRQSPSKVRDPHIVLFNQPLASSLGLDSNALMSTQGEEVFSGNKIPEGADPIAQAYAGHQFGHFNMLGDGRAILLGEHITPDNMRVDIQLKGAGATAYSRRGDGRAALGPMLREYIISETMHALNIPSTRSLAVVTTGEPVYRERTLPGAILTRVAASHIRVGTFQYASSSLGVEGVRSLANYTIHRHFADLEGTENKYSAFLDAVIDRQSKLIAQWMSVGFIHGVMNTDNMSICGETIDYGPCAFMDNYDQATVFSSIDQLGRYAFGNQPHMGQWNLARFAETLLPLLSQHSNLSIQIAEDALHGFSIKLKRHWLSIMGRKLGLFNEQSGDLSLVEDLLSLMQSYQMDYTNTLRKLANTIKKPESISNQTDFIQWHQRWHQRLQSQAESIESAIELMQSNNPCVIARNHQVESALAAAEQGDLSLTAELIEVLSQPYDENPKNKPYQAAPTASSEPYKTFCGT